MRRRYLKRSTRLFIAITIGLVIISGIFAIILGNLRDKVLESKSSPQGYLEDISEQTVSVTNIEVVYNKTLGEEDKEYDVHFANDGVRVEFILPERDVVASDRDGESYVSFKYAKDIKGVKDGYYDVKLHLHQ